MAKGTIKTWKGRFGFIADDAGGSDVFLHINEVPQGDKELLKAGTVVSFEVQETPKGLAAHKVRLQGTFSQQSKQSTSAKQQSASPSQETGKSESSPGDAFHNPYTFVPTPPRPSKGFASDFDPLKCGLDHASLKPNLWTGHIPIKLTTVTPLVLLKTDGEDRDITQHQTYDVLDYIPESSLRGMLRSAYEVVTNSRYGCFGNDDRLAYRMDTGEAIKLIPAIIENGTACLFPGTSHATTQGPSGVKEKGATYAAMLRLYGDKKLQSERDTGYTPKTGDEVWAEIVLCQHEVSPRFRNHWLNDYRFWKVVMVWPKNGHSHAPTPTNKKPWYSSRQTPDSRRRQSYYAPLNPEDRRIVKGHVLITNENMGNKHDERIFFNPQPNAFDITEDVKDAWRMRIKSYREAHSESDIFGRRNARNQPWKKIGNRTGQTAWSPHLYQDGKHQDRWGREAPDAAELKPGDMVYARCKFDSNGDIKKIEDLFPVMISRELYANSPANLLDSSLKPASSRKKLSPADRLFGWVPQGQGSDEGYKSRIRVVCEESPRPEIVERFNGGNLPLTILGQPKPAQGRFYVADNQGKPQHEVDKTDAGYDASQGKSLRGRKQYWHHKGLEANKAKAYWHPSAEDRTQTKHDNRYQEYRRPDRNGQQQTDPQNRSIEGWIKPGTEFTVSLYVQNLQPEEIGALLWLLSLPESHYFKLGYGKPLGFGSVRIEIDKDRYQGVCLPLGTDEDWRAYYAAFDASPPATLDDTKQKTCRDTFKASMVAAYNANLSFDDLPFIADFLQILKGPIDDSPIHYPRLDRKPTPEGENFRWFTENERNFQDALPDVTDQDGLPYEPYNA